MTPRPASEPSYGDMNPHEIGPAQGFWALLTAEEQAVLADLGRIRVFAPGAMICDEGEPASDRDAPGDFFPRLGSTQLDLLVLKLLS